MKQLMQILFAIAMQALVPASKVEAGEIITVCAAAAAILKGAKGRAVEAYFRILGGPVARALFARHGFAVR
jgi:hypothetical protein